MSFDRYTKAVLTIIAVELGWIALNGVAVPVSAQRNDPMPVIIRGVQGPPGREVYIPVTVVGSTAPLRITSDRPLQIEAPLPLRIETERPLPVQNGDRPLLIQTVPDPPAKKPGV